MTTTTRLVQPHGAMLYFPLPPSILQTASKIYALMDPKDNQTTAVFGTVDYDKDRVYLVLQSDRDIQKVFTDKDGWNITVRSASGLLAFTADQARAMWDKLIADGWTVIPDQSPTT